MNSNKRTDKILQTLSTVVLLVLAVPVLVLAQTNSDKKKTTQNAPSDSKSAARVQPRSTQPPNVNRPTQPNVNKPTQPIVSHPPIKRTEPPTPPSVHKPGPDVKREQQPGGGTAYTHADGRHWEVGKTGQLTHFSKPGMEARFGDNGRLSSAHLIRHDGSEITVRRTFHGERRIEVVRPDHSRLVSAGRNRSYLERPLSTRPGFVERTYIVRGRAEVRVYRTFSYEHVVYYRYVPAVYYHPSFYAWAYNPWTEPIVYGWGWGGERWHGFYGGYFQPAPAYPTATLWLTDFLLAENLKLAYEDRQTAVSTASPIDAPPPRQGFQNTASALTPEVNEVKQMIAEEVKQQLAAEQAVSDQPGSGSPQQATPTVDEVPPALDPRQRVFVVSTNLDVNVAGQACALTPGDIILRTDDTIVDGNSVGVSILNSKTGDCPVNSATKIEVAALQEMHNQFREQISSGLKLLAENQGKGGLPAGPAPSARQVRERQPAPDLNVDQALLAQQADANQIESEVKQAASSVQSMRADNRKE